MDGEVGGEGPGRGSGATHIRKFIGNWRISGSTAGELYYSREEDLFAKHGREESLPAMKPQPERT